MNPGISSDLTEFISGQLIESSIMFTVPGSGSILIEETILECATSGNSITEIIPSNFSPGNLIFSIIK